MFKDDPDYRMEAEYDAFIESYDLDDAALDEVEEKVEESLAIYIEWETQDQ